MADGWGRVRNRVVEKHFVLGRVGTWAFKATERPLKSPGNLKLYLCQDWGPLFITLSPFFVHSGICKLVLVSPEFWGCWWVCCLVTAPFLQSTQPFRGHLSERARGWVWCNPKKTLPCKRLLSLVTILSSTILETKGWHFVFVFLFEVQRLPIQYVWIISISLFLSVVRWEDGRLLLRLCYSPWKPSLFPHLLHNKSLPAYFLGSLVKGLTLLSLRSCSICWNLLVEFVFPLPRSFGGQHAARKTQAPFLGSQVRWSPPWGLRAVNLLSPGQDLLFLTPGTRLEGRTKALKSLCSCLLKLVFEWRVTWGGSGRRRPDHTTY